MKISELSRTTGTPIPTIKYYIREGLLHRGTPTATNQADYDESHVQRLRLIRVLREVGDLSVATITQVVAALDHPEARARADHVATALRSLSPEPGPISERSLDSVANLVDRLGWEVDEDCAGYQSLAAALTALEEHWPSSLTLDQLMTYGRIAERLASFEIPEDWNPSESANDALTYAVLGTVLFEPVILSLRRLAHVDRHRRLIADRL
jgi:DNA-binding transcriptional MerR regulator